MNFHPYPSIENHYKNDAIFNSVKVVVQEKIDGTNFAFGWLDGRRVICSRNNVIWSKDKLDQERYNQQADGFKMKNSFLEKFGFEIFDKVRNLYTEMDGYDSIGQEKTSVLFYGEFHGNGIQKRIKYYTEPKKDFVFFDAWYRFEDGQEGFYNFSAFDNLANSLSLKTVPVLYIGRPSRHIFEKYLNVSSVFAAANGVEIENNITEGIVIKDLFEQYPTTKWKSSKFSERLPMKDLKNFQTDAGHYSMTLAQRYVSDGRMYNCYEKFQTNGGLTFEKIKDVCEYIKQDCLKDLVDEDKLNENFDLKIFQKYVMKIAGSKTSSFLRNKK